MNLRRLPLPELALFSLTLAWGYSFVVVTLALRETGPVTLTFIRMVIGVGFLLALRPRSLAATRFEWRAGIVGGLLLAGGYILQTAGMTGANASKSGFLTSFYVPLVPVCEALVYRRWPPLRDLGALALATIGIAVMVLGPALSLSLGEGLVAASALCWAAQIVLVGRVADRADPIRLAVIQLLVVGVVTGISVPFSQETWPAWTTTLVFQVLFLGVVTNALAFLAQAWAQKLVTPTRTAILFSPEPVIAAICGWWLLDEVLGRRDYAGAVLVMAAVVIAVWKPGIEGARPAAGS